MDRAPNGDGRLQLDNSNSKKKIGAQAAAGARDFHPMMRPVYKFRTRIEICPVRKMEQDNEPED